jgi:hypothetical protein
MSKITVIINPKNGEVQYQVEGVVGSSCTDLTSALLRDKEVVEQRLTAEYTDVAELPDYIHTPEGE